VLPASDAATGELGAEQVRRAFDGAERRTIACRIARGRSVAAT
jgi:hypothetical protein